MQSYIKNIFNTSIFSFMNILVSFITSIVISRYYGPEGRGFIYLPITIITLFLPIVAIGYKQSLSFYIGEKKINIDDALSLVKNKIFYLIIITSLVFSLTFVYFNKVYSGLTLTLFFIILFRSLIDVYSFFHLIKKRNFLINMLLLFRSTFELIFILSAVSLNATPSFIIYIYLLSSIFCLYIQYQLIQVKREENNSNHLKENNDVNFLELTKKGISYSIPLFLIGLNVSFSLLILSHYNSLSDVGLYQAAITIANMLWILPNILSPVTFSFVIGQKKHTTQYNDIFIKNIIIICLNIPIFVILFLISDYIFTLLYGSDFAESAIIFKILLPGYFFMLIYKVTYPFIAALGHTNQTSLLFFITFIISIILNILLIPKYSIIGAAVSTLVTFSICGILFLILTYKIIKK